MFKISWDKETGGIKLSSSVNKDTLGVSPRPVFFEELDLLKLNELGWKYPKNQEPLLWACNKQYFYRGKLVFEVKGANIYDAATVFLQSDAKDLHLKPVDLKAMLKKCKDEMFLIESEAIEFIRGIYVQYSAARKSVKEVMSNQLDYEALAVKIEKQTKQKMAIVKQDCDSFDIMPLDNAKQEGKKTYQTTRIDKFLASFSGGKDSQVVLDLCVRAIPPSAFEVIYSDTGYELPTSLTLYEEVKRFYKNKFPELKFSTARNHETVLNYWDKIGTPSDTHRWCCSIMKTAPLYRMLKVDGTNKQAKVLTFDGVRAEESSRRSEYGRIGKGVKHDTVINASPILNWTTTEIFLYLFLHNLPINSSYRQGMTRVGCLICPFSSEWNDMISHTCYLSNLQPFLSRVEKITIKSGVKDVNEYIKKGNWKRRAGGRGMSFPSYMEIISVKPDLKIRCISPQKNILTWLSAVGDYTVHSSKFNITGELSFKRGIFRFSIEQSEKEQIIVFENTSVYPVLQGLIKRALYKATYCLNCESCEVECPTGALSILPEAIIDKKKCTHCHKCLLFHDFGCIVANSLNVTGNNNSNNMKLISYNNFGLKEEWLDVFMSSVDTYFIDNNHGLNLKEQLPNFVKWLVQSEILIDSKTKQIASLGKLLSNIYCDMPNLAWEIIWINLTYNAPIAKWYKENIDWNFNFTQADIQELLKNDYPSDSTTTIKNIVYALFRTFRESPIGNMGLCVEIEKLSYKKIPFENLSREAFAYSLYKYSEIYGVKSCRVSDFYLSDNKQGVYREFGISKGDFEKHLRSLNSDTNRILVAELNMGLDHITLRDDLTSLKVLSLLSNQE
jgi:3'-phosphoadenosine 5'-phosphosulfate sulfotransferase (PAPS reductase)/FAD synthetase/ferredoxin